MSTTKGRWAPLLLTAIGLVWAVSAAANFYAGWSLSSNPFVGTTLGGASIAADVIKAGMFWAIAGLLYAGKKPLAGVACLVFALAAMWSMFSAVRFASGTLMHRAVTNEHNSDSLSLKKTQLAAVLKQLDNWQGEVKIGDPLRFKYRKDRTAAIKAQEAAMEHNRKVLAERTALQDRADKLQTEIAGYSVTLKGDAIAVTYGLDSRHVVMFLSVFFALLLEVVSGVGFWLVSESRAQRRERRPPDATPAGYGSGAYSGGPPPGPNEPDQAPTPRAIAPPADLVATQEQPPASQVVQLKSIKEDTRVTNMRQAITDLYEPGGPEDRERWSDFRTSVNGHLKPSHRVRTKAANELLLPALYALKWEHLDKRKAGPHIWVYGIKRKAKVDNAKRIGDKLRVVR
jgi:hypothetical protein